jgi:hypothetical protein
MINYNIDTFEEFKYYSVFDTDNERSIFFDFSIDEVRPSKEDELFYLNQADVNGITTFYSFLTREEEDVIYEDYSKLYVGKNFHHSKERKLKPYSKQKRRSFNLVF